TSRSVGASANRSDPPDRPGGRAAPPGLTLAGDTHQRILDASLALFNAQGEPHVSTNHIAAHLGISPGNLYYHFRNKDDIIDQLFARCEARLDTALAVPVDRPPHLEDLWLQLHLV